METVNGVYKAECVRTTIFHDSPYRTIADIDYATVGWVDWYNHRRLHGSRGMGSPNEYEATYDVALTRAPRPTQKRQRTWDGSWSSQNSSRYVP